MKFKVGDRVRIREYLKADNPYGIQLFIYEMAKYKDREAIIEQIHPGYYCIDLDNHYYSWTDEMLEPVEMTIPQLQSEIDKLGNEVDKQNGLLVSNKQRLCYLKSELKKLQRKKPILDEKEKEYLSAVIKPFRDKVKCISKVFPLSASHSYITETLGRWQTGQSDECIKIAIRGSSTCGSSTIIFPYFKKGTMYKGMEIDKEYTLKELGL